MKQLARDKAYDNVAFHRVIDGFMAQTGDVENANMEAPATTRAGRARAARNTRPAGRILQAAA
jgi:cyclophilin family peptidyl-prolyl cis-trans isomerase